ncbi:MAG: STAS domain-containing protein [Victivallales bacterium]|nr:STAS domain-containing protein [Victivallales bacterium]
MKINKSLEQNTLTLALEGRLDTVSAPELEDALSASLDGVTALVLDLAKLDYLSSAGLRVLLSAHKRMSGKDGTMTLRNVSETVKDVFDITGFTDFLNIE